MAKKATKKIASKANKKTESKKKVTSQKAKTKKITPKKIEAKIVKAKKSLAKPKSTKKVASKPTKKVKTVTKTPKKVTGSPIKKVDTKINLVKVSAKKAPKKIIAGTDYKEQINNLDSIKKQRKSAKKPIITLPPPPVIEVSNFPKNKIKNVLISQPKPAEPDKNPYLDLGSRYGLNINFRQFIKVEGLSSQEFRLQRIEILHYGAVILTSKLSVDHYFRICNEMRVTVPDSMKFFCINEQTAYYLQKYIQYRKRKIFFGHGTMLDLVDVIRKNKEEKFLLPVSDVHKEQIVDFLDELKITYTKSVFYKTVSANLSDMKNLNEYDLLVFFTPAGIKSLKQNFPNFKQGNTRIAAFGHTAAQKVKELGYRLDIFAPNPLNPSMSGAINTYLKESNKR